jgi:hypothetical protein
LATAIRTTTERPFRRFWLNQWTQADELWLPAGSGTLSGSENLMTTAAGAWARPVPGSGDARTRSAWASTGAGTTEQQHARDEGGKEAREAISRSISRIG